jgi:type I restriction enzyme M protein
MFYNTGIATYVWILSSGKPAERQNTVQLIDATERYSKMRKSLGSKRQYIHALNSDAIVDLYSQYAETDESKIFPVETFGYRRITVERPLRLNFQASPERIERIREEKPIQKLDEATQSAVVAACQRIDAETVHYDRDAFIETVKKALRAQGVKPTTAIGKAVVNALSERDPGAEPCTESKGRVEADIGLRDHENVPLTEFLNDYFEREVRPHVPDAWIDEAKRDPHDGEVGIVGYEIPFNRYFYVFQPPRPLEEIDADLRECTDRIKRMIEDLSA